MGSPIRPFLHAGVFRWRDLLERAPFALFAVPGLERRAPLPWLERIALELRNHGGRLTGWQAVELAARACRRRGRRPRVSD